MFKRIPAETKLEILEKIKNGMTVFQASQIYAVSTKTIYAWLSNQARKEISVLEYNRLKRENEELKRIIGLITLELERGKKIKIVNQSNNKKLIAECMNINHKNIYYQSKKDIKDIFVKTAIEKVFENNPSYGHRRLALQLKMNKKKILRIMHKYNLKPPRLWYLKKFTTKSDPTSYIKYTNLLKNWDLKANDIGDIWSSDLTYIKYQDKFFYLVIIQDIILKEIVGFNLSDKHDSNMVLKTLKEAIINTKIVPKIFHCDRGREYLSKNCTDFLENLKVKISVSDPGSPWQNSWSESFFSRFKCEFGSFSRFDTLGELIENIYQYLNYYNSKRIQLKLKMSPYQFKQKISENGLEKWGA